MPANGSEITTESRISQSPAIDGRSGRAVAEGKPPAAKGPITRRRRNREEGPKTNGEERFFLAGANRNGDTPALGRECASEAEAIIDAFRERVNFYRVAEFQTRADVGPAGEPILRKDGLKKNNPAS